MNSSLPLSSPFQSLASEPESATIQELRKERQLLIAELKDRDKELNDMVAVHQRQFLAWGDDRQKILTLEERNSRLENELHKRNEIITALTRRLKVLESQQNDHIWTLESTQQKLQELSQKASSSSFQCQTLEEKNQILASSAMDLSNRVAQLEAGEQELLTKLRLKDNEILEAAKRIAEVTSKFKKLESALHAARLEESSINKEKQNFKLRLKEVMLEANKLKGDLNEKTKENSAQREVIMQLEQESTSLRNQLMFTAQMANTKDQLLLSTKSKQLRTDTELNNLRQICMKQQQDLQFLHFNLESSQENIQKHKTELQDGSRGMVLSDLESSSDRDSVCGEVSPKIHRQAIRLPDRVQSRQRERRLATVPHVLEGPLRHPRCLHREVLNLSSPGSAGEAENRLAAWPESPRKSESRELASVLELGILAPLSRHEHWLDLKSCAAPSDGPALGLLDTSDGDRAGASVDSARIALGQSPSVPASPGNAGELGRGGACSPVSQATLYRALRNRERMRIFKPIEKGGGGSWGRELSQSPLDAPELKSDHGASLDAFDLGVPCFTSTQKSKETLPGPDGPSELPAPSGCCYPSLRQDACSPTSKLQRVLAASRQMVTDHELCPCFSPTNSLRTVEVGPESSCEGKAPAEEETEMKLSLFP
ncbi:coiled-coil domain-containing protein 62 isoform 1-T3 [Liasis olivaceus]